MVLLLDVVVEGDGKTDDETRVLLDVVVEKSAAVLEPLTCQVGLAWQTTKWTLVE
jgi:hypothetical protein